MEMHEWKDGIIETAVRQISYKNNMSQADKSELTLVLSNYLADGSITDIHQIPTACGGLFPTHKKLIKKQEFSQAEAQNFESAEPPHKHR
jgi:hypothetical protein